MGNPAMLLVFLCCPLIVFDVLECFTLIQGGNHINSDCTPEALKVNCNMIVAFSTL